MFIFLLEEKCLFWICLQKHASQFHNCCTFEKKTVWCFLCCIVFFHNAGLARTQPSSSTTTLLLQSHAVVIEISPLSHLWCLGTDKQYLLSCDLEADGCQLPTIKSPLTLWQTFSSILFSKCSQGKILVLLFLYKEPSFSFSACSRHDVNTGQIVFFKISPVWR